MNFENKTAATSAMPNGIPGCPDFDFSIASALRKRMALAISGSFLSLKKFIGIYSSIFLKNYSST